MYLVMVDIILCLTWDEQECQVLLMYLVMVDIILCLIWDEQECQVLLIYLVMADIILLFFSSLNVIHYRPPCLAQPRLSLPAA